MTTRSLSSLVATDVPSTNVQISHQSGQIKLVNSSAKRIVFGVSTALKKATTTPTGVLDPNESANFVVKSEGNEHNDQVTIIYTQLPEGSEKRYNSDYFRAENAYVTRKNVKCRFAKITAVLSKIEANK
uniref:MSP domain-containing protein n=1 Tax=Caenorhabditis japonica TaxID=281687 RepID=A0A8R1I0N7_CAEJA